MSRCGTTKHLPLMWNLVRDLQLNVESIASTEKVPHSSDCRRYHTPVLSSALRCMYAMHGAMLLHMALRSTMLVYSER